MRPGCCGYQKSTELALDVQSSLPENSKMGPKPIAQAQSCSFLSPACSTCSRGAVACGPRECSWWVILRIFFVAPCSCKRQQLQRLPRTAWTLNAWPINVFLITNFIWPKDALSLFFDDWAGDSPHRAKRL